MIGETEVTVKEGCPLIPTKQALELIEEIEERTLGQAHLAKSQAEEKSWKKAWSQVKASFP